MRLTSCSKLGGMMMSLKWLSILCATLLALTICGCQSGKPTSDAFDLNQAVDIVLALHPEFPPAGGTKEIETMTGGKYPGTKVSGTLATSVDPSGEPDVYHVTLTKKWRIKIGDQEVEGFWKYRVTPQGAELMASADNTDLLNIIK